MRTAHRTAVGLTLYSLRVLRRSTSADIAIRCGVAPSTITALEAGKRHADGKLIRVIAERMGATLREREALAASMAQGAADGLDVRYDLAPSSPAGHAAAASLSVFGPDLTSASWARIHDIVERDIAGAYKKSAA